MIRALLLALAMLAAPLQAAEVDRWLARIGPALRGLDYEGTLVYLADGRIETMKRGDDASNIGVVAREGAISLPEGIARTGRLGERTASVERAERDFFVRNGDVPAAA